VPVCVHVTENQFRRGVAEVNVYDCDISPVRSTDNCSVPQIDKLLSVSRVYLSAILRLAILLGLRRRAHSEAVHLFT